jgi:putative membrane protein
MIVRPSTNWLRMLFVWRGSVLPAILPQLLLMLLTSTLALRTDGRIFGAKLPLDTAALPLLGLSLAIFLGFRNNASYQRYTEARLNWGRLLIAARALTSQVNGYLPPQQAALDRPLFVRRVIASVYALKHQLRGTDPMPELAAYLPPQELAALKGREFLAIALLDQVRLMLAEAAPRRAGRGEILMMLDRQLNDLAAAAGSCERICNTPIPYAYGVLLHRTVYLYCFLLPFGLVDAIGVATPLITVFVSYTFFALEAIAQQVAEPFGSGENCLALNAMARNIERSVLEQCGEALPAALAPDADYQIN